MVYNTKFLPIICSFLLVINLTSCTTDNYNDGIIEVSNCLCKDLVAIYGIEKSLPTCLEQAKFSDVSAQMTVAISYVDGSLGKIDWEQAMPFFLSAAQNGHNEAQYITAQNYYLGRGTNKNIDEAVSWLTQAAKDNYAPAQLLLGKWYYIGINGNKDNKLAGFWITKSAQQENLEALQELAFLYLQGEGVQKNYIVAEKLLLQCAEKSYIPAMISLGDFYREGKNGKIDIAKAAYWYNKALNTNHVQAEYNLALLLLKKEWYANLDPISLLAQAAKNSFVPAQLELAKIYHQGINAKRDDYLAFQWYSAAAESHDAQACYQVGLALTYGDFNQKKNIPLGIKYLIQSAQNGFYPAQYLIANLFIDGYPLEISRFQILQYLTPAAENGNVSAQIKLAKLLSNFSLPEYDKLAFLWLKKAAVYQNSEAMYLLAEFYLNGIGIETNYHKAFELYFQLAQQNHPLSQLQLGKMYYHGQGIQKNTFTAGEYFLKAAQTNIKEAKYWVAILYKDIVNNNLIESLEKEKYNFFVNCAAENNIVEALYFKGMSHFFGNNDFEHSFELGFQLIEQAAQQQFTVAQRQMGIIYEEGLFGTPNINKALYWYHLASSKGDAYSYTRLKEMELQNAFN